MQSCQVVPQVCIVSFYRVDLTFAFGYSMCFCGIHKYLIRLQSIAEVALCSFCLIEYCLQLTFGTLLYYAKAKKAASGAIC